MSDLSYVHPQQRSSTAARDPPPETCRTVTQEWRPNAEQIQQRLLSAAEEESERVRSTATAAEARRWKDEHDKMSQAATELAYKVTSAQRQLEEANIRHKNLQDNHAGMQAKYSTLKEELETLRATDSTELRLKAIKWKAKSKGLEEQLEQHRARAAESDDLQDELIDAEAELEAVHEENQALRQELASARLAATELRELKEELPAVKAALKEGRKVTQQRDEELLPKLADTQRRLEAAQTRAEQDMEKIRAQAAKDIKALRQHAADEIKDLKQQSARELGRTKEELDTARSRLQAMTAASEQLSQLQQEIPVVKDKLQEGKQAVQRLAATEAELAALRGKAKELAQTQQDLAHAQAALASAKGKAQEARQTQQELAEIRAELASAKAKAQELPEIRAELASAKDQLRELSQLKKELPLVKSKLLEGRHLEQELAEARSELQKRGGAATKQSESLQSAKEQVKACARMLVTAEQVLQACTDLHAKQGSPLSTALAQTSARVSEFLRDLQA